MREKNKMKILLINIDSKLPNIALKKTEKYYLDKGDEIIWDLEMFKVVADKIYVSCIFDWNKYKCEEWEAWGAEIGGSGYDLKKTLPEEIDKIKIKINMGFTTRGCIRKCKFCIVPQKEGKFEVVGDIYDFWDGKSKEIVLFDNNILVSPKHFKMICSQIRKEKLKVDFNQGLDCRLLTEDIVKELKKTKCIAHRFAFDNIKDMSHVEKAIKLLDKYNIKAMWYILVGFDSTFEEDIERIDYITYKEHRAFAMKHKKVKDNNKYTQLARWTNSPLWRNAMPFKDFIKIKGNRI